MGKFIPKAILVTAITFDELVEHGLKCKYANIVDGMPWSFEYQGYPITHESDSEYLIITGEGILHFTKDDMLVTNSDGEIYPFNRDLFDKTYELIEDGYDSNILNIGL